VELNENLVTSNASLTLKVESLESTIRGLKNKNNELATKVEKLTDQMSFLNDIMVPEYNKMLQ